MFLLLIKYGYQPILQRIFSPCVNPLRVDEHNPAAGVQGFGDARVVGAIIGACRREDVEYCDGDIGFIDLLRKLRVRY